MFSLVLIILASLIPFVVTWITSPEEIFLTTDESKPKQIFKKDTSKRLSKKGKWFIAAIVLTSIFASIQFIQNEKDKKALNNERDIRDSIITAKINYGNDSSRKILFSNLSEALAKQNLQYDSSQKRIEKLITDSSKRVTNVISENEPSLMLNTNPVTLDSSNGNYRYFGINIKAFKGEVYNANLHLKVIKESNKELSLFKINSDVGIENERLTEGMRTFIPVNLYASRGTILYFYVFGYYTNSTNKKKIPFDEICMFDLNDFVSAFLTAEPNRRIRKFLSTRW